jgi:beta-galactosidase
MRGVSPLVGALSVLWLGAVARAAMPVLSDGELEVDHALTFEFATPHTDWGHPWAAGRTRVLFFSDGRQTTARECVELMQRFDLEADAVFWALIADSPDSHWHGGEAGLARALRLLERRWDCFVFVDCAFGRLPDEHQVRILEQVEAGAGLVCCGIGDERVLKPSNRIAPTPPWIDRLNVMAAHRLGNGRGVLLSQCPVYEYSEEWQARIDHWQERLGRAVLWAAGRQPGAAVTIALAEGTPDTATATLTGALIGSAPRLELRLRRQDEEKAAFGDLPLTVDSPRIIPLPHLPAGEYWADARVLSSAGVETWESLDFRVQSRRTVEAVRLSRPWGEIGETIEGKVVLASDPLPKEQLVVGLRDRHRRLLVRQTSDRPAAETPFRFAIPSWVPMLVTVEATLYADGLEFSRGYAYANVVKRRQGHFNFVMWGVPGGPLAPYGEATLARHGVTVQLGSGVSRLAAAFDIPWVPYTTRITPYAIPDPAMKQYSFPFCWADQQAVADHARKLAEGYAGARQQGVFVWSLGDETTTQGASTSEHDLRAYRRYLRETYGTLTALNASWSTQFGDWDQITLSKAPTAPDLESYRAYLRQTYGMRPLAYLWFTSWQQWSQVPFDAEFYEREEVASWEQRNYARWFDRMAFKSWNFATLCAAYGREFRAADPQARTGVEGAGEFNRGDDPDLIVRSTGFWAPYPDPINEVIRSIAPRDYPRGNWMGYQKDAETLLGHYWNMVTRGMDGVWWWSWEGIGQFHGWIAPDLRPFPAVKEILADTQIVRDGLGDLLLRSEMQDDGIAVLYSHPSVYAHKLEQGSAFGDYQLDHQALHGLVRDLGLQFRYVTDRMLRLGEFRPERYKVLILPRADAIGDREAEVIAEFARHGGTLIADVRPGVFTEHCQARTAGVLDGLFGVRRTAPMGLATAVSGDLPGLGFALSGATADAGIETAGAVPAATLEGVPLVVRNPVGRGRAILLNVPFAGYPPLSSDRTPEAAAAFFGQLLAGAGVTPALGLRNDSGERLRNIELVRWLDGANEIIALFRADGASSPARVVLPAAKHVYDLRRRIDLGKTAAIGTTVWARRATFFALCPAPVPDPRLRWDDARVRRGDCARLFLSVPGAGGWHALRLRVAGNDGPMAWHDQVVLAGEDAVTVDVPVAYNDPAGDYRVTATELFSNRDAEARLRVK